MNDSIFQLNVRQALDRSVKHIDQATLVKLRSARSHALEQYDAHAEAPAFAWAGPFRFGHATGSRRSLVYWAAALLFMACLINGVAYWQHMQDNDDINADISILTDEMPIEVYLD